VRVDLVAEVEQRIVQIREPGLFWPVFVPVQSMKRAACEGPRVANCVRSIESGSRCPYVRSICSTLVSHEPCELEQRDAGEGAYDVWAARTERTVPRPL
jgi:hypothetical protein